jgi:hypothetical protein
LHVEARRVLDRLRVEALLDDAATAQAYTVLRAIERAIDRIALTRRVLDLAALPMPTAVETLDAIHLASAHRPRRAAMNVPSPVERGRRRSARAASRRRRSR